MTPTLSVSLFLLVCVVAAYTDLRWRRVPNLLTYGTMAALIIITIPTGLLSLTWMIGALAATILAGSVIFGLGLLGGGDLKLLAAGAAAFGFPAFLIVLLYISCAGGILAAIYALREGRLRTVFTTVTLSAVFGTKVVPAAGARRIPYALAICAGAFSYAASESFAPWLRFVH